MKQFLWSKKKKLSKISLGAHDRNKIRTWVPTYMEYSITWGSDPLSFS